MERVGLEELPYRAQERDSAMPSQGSTVVTHGLVQMRCESQPEANVEKAVQQIREAAKRGAQIICLQELFRAPYFCQREDAALFDLAEPIPGPTSERMSAVARETQ